MEDDYKVIDVNADFKIITVIPYTDGSEFRKYVVNSESLAETLNSLNDPKIAETVVKVKKKE